eukprot:CAMPEP_0119125294 /NCGR_PEP_ID=MMETSP1310-20130426/4621_1 /TAXON_ID=464262 /ORGANISM="Genus nov. species nov., Strain RCC2339" /LENGTH=176 /DNA_ID=CAMNT_0007115345 /DNA_START=187 /DNA_END=717 /DNA_ORIENTATION=+
MRLWVLVLAAVVVVAAAGVGAEEEVVVGEERSLNPPEISIDFSWARSMQDASGNVECADKLTFAYRVMIRSGLFEPTNVAVRISPEEMVTLTAGTVTTSTGTVGTGNTAGDSFIVVDIGDLSSLTETIAVITFDVVIKRDAVDGSAFLSDQSIVVTQDFWPATSQNFIDGIFFTCP